MDRAQTSLKFFLIMPASALVASCATQHPRPPDSTVPGIFFDNPALFEFDDRAGLRSVSEPTLDLAKTSEQFRASPYNDPVRFCTIAYGHLIVRAPCGPPQIASYPTPLTESQGVELLAQDMRFAEIAVTKGVTRDLTDSQYGALCDFVFNVGAGNFMQSRLRRLINSGVLEQIPSEWRLWRRANGQILPGLVKRREAELALFFQGLELPRFLPEDTPSRPDIDIFTGRAVR